jgi:hypothetical protein
VGRPASDKQNHHLLTPAVATLPVPQPSPQLGRADQTLQLPDGCHHRPVRLSAGVDPAKFRLVAVYNDNPDTWTDLEWRNIYDPDGPSYRITTDWTSAAEADVVIVKSHADVLREYRVHPEYKYNGPDGRPCRRNSSGLLQRRPIHLAGLLRLIGKEANNIEEVQAGRYAQLDEIITEYQDPNDDQFHQTLMPALGHLSGRELARHVGTDRRTIDRIRAGQKPRIELQKAIIGLAEQIQLKSASHQNNIPGCNLKLSDLR